jgi:hypothetical protein
MRLSSRHTGCAAVRKKAATVLRIDGVNVVKCAE